MNDKRPIGEEPTIDEMLEDPIVALIMRRDGLLPGDVRAVWTAAARRLQATPDSEKPESESAEDSVIEAA